MKVQVSDYCCADLCVIEGTSQLKIRTPDHGVMFCPKQVATRSACLDRVSRYV